MLFSLAHLPLAGFCFSKAYIQGIANIDLVEGQQARQPVSKHGKSFLHWIEKEAAALPVLSTREILTSRGPTLFLK